MMVASSDPLPLTLYFSPWKVAGTQLLMAVLASWPFVFGLPTTGRHAFYSYPPFNIILYGLAALIGVMVIAVLPVLRRAIRGLPAVEVSEDRFTIYSVPPRSVPRSSIGRMEPFKNFPIKRGVVKIYADGQKPLELGLWWCKQLSVAWRQLEAVTANRAIMDENISA